MENIKVYKIIIINSKRAPIIKLQSNWWTLAYLFSWSFVPIIIQSNPIQLYL